jgi:hypothetical protein
MIKEEMIYDKKKPDFKEKVVEGCLRLIAHLISEEIEIRSKLTNLE